jgi:hypothetical protein
MGFATKSRSVGSDRQQPFFAGVRIIVSSINAPDGVINTSFPETPFGEVYAFGWRTFKAALRDQLLYLLVVLAAAVAIAVWSSNGAYKPGNSPQVGFLVVFPAIAVAGRFFDPAYKLNFNIVAGIVGIWAMFFIGFLIVLCPVLIALIFKAYELLWIYVAIVPLAIWVSVKLCFAPIIYAFTPEGERNVFRAMRTSWAEVAEDTWWRAVGISICIGLSAVLPGAIASGIAFAMLQGINTMAAILVAVALYCCGDLISSIWRYGAFAAMVSGLPDAYSRSAYTVP